MSTYTGLQYSDTNSSTLAGITQDIYFLAKCNAQSISAGDLNRIINKYYAQVQNAIKAINENFYLVVATTNLVISTNAAYTFPDGTGTAPPYEKIKSIWAAFLPASSSNPLASEFQRLNCVDCDSIQDPSYTFTNPTAVLFDTYFCVFPLVTDVTIYPVTNGLKI